MTYTDDDLRRFFAKKSGVVAVYLFGSGVGRDRDRAGDVDVAVLYERENEPDDFKRIEEQEDLAARLRKSVDLVVLNRAPVVLHMQVLKKGRPVLIRDRKAFNRFVVATLREYFELKMVRRPVEEKLSGARVLG